MVKIPLLPRTWYVSLRNTFTAVVRSPSVILGIWRLMLVVLLVLLIAVMIAYPPGAVAGFVIFTILGAVFRDEILGTARDLWDLNFWGIEI